MEYDCNIAYYLISKIHEEDAIAGIESKIRITEEILANRDILIQYPKFYDEECLLSLINWAYNISNKDILIKNIINILESFPITPCDLISFSFISKLNKINQHLKFSNFLLYQQIKQIKFNWKNLIFYYQQQVSNNFFLGKKRVFCAYENDCKNLHDFNSQKSCQKKVSWKNEPQLVEIIPYNPDSVILVDSFPDFVEGSRAS